MNMRHGVARHQRDDVAEAIHRVIEPLRSGGRERGAQAQAQGPVAGIDGAGGLELGDAFAPQALPAQRVAERAARRDQLRIEPDGGAQVLDRGRHVAAQADEPAELVMGAGIGGIERDGAAIAGRRLLERAARLQQEGELALRPRMVRMRRDQLPVKRARAREIAAERDCVGTIGQGGGARILAAGQAVVALVHAGRAPGMGCGLKGLVATLQSCHAIGTPGGSPLQVDFAIDDDIRQVGKATGSRHFSGPPTGPMIFPIKAQTQSGDTFRTNELRRPMGWSGVLRRSPDQTNPGRAS